MRQLSFYMLCSVNYNCQTLRSGIINNIFSKFYYVLCASMFIRRPQSSSFTCNFIYSVAVDSIIKTIDSLLVQDKCRVIKIITRGSTTHLNSFGDQLMQRFQFSCACMSVRDSKCITSQTLYKSIFSELGRLSLFHILRILKFSHNFQCVSLRHVNATISRRYIVHIAHNSLPSVSSRISTHS